MQRHRFFGALDAITGEWYWADHDRKMAVNFVAFLEAVSEAYPGGVLYLALDSAPTHTAKVVQKWLLTNPRVHALWLPKYAAHKHNPVEQMWGLMKGDVAANRLVGTIDELVNYARRFFSNLRPRVTLQEAA